MLPPLALGLALFASSPLAPVRAGDDPERPLDRVVLKDGEVLEGHVVYEGDEHLTLQVGSREREIPTAEVEEVRSVARSMNLVLDQYAYVDTTDPRQMLDIARFARGRDLEGLARLFALRALDAAPENEEAHLFLDHRRQGKSWKVKVGSRRLKFQDLEEHHSDWGEAWQLHTPHYALRTNLRLREALDVAMDLELLYREFYSRFGKELRLRELVQRLGADVHADSKSYPEVTGASAYFDARRITTVVNAERGYLREFVIHEAVHQLLFATAVSAVHTPDARGCIPAWLDEGLATYFQVIQEGRLGHVTFDDRKQSAHFLALHRTAPKPYDLSRVLTFGTEDFHGSSNIDLKYAQSYSLVEFWLRGDFYRHRESFFDLLRAAYAGSCSPTDVKRAMTLDDDDFEAAWNAHVGRGD